MAHDRQHPEAEQAPIVLSRIVSIEPPGRARDEFEEIDLYVSSEPSAGVCSSTNVAHPVSKVKSGDDSKEAGLLSSLNEKLNKPECIQPWWEELFDEDFVQITGDLTEDQVRKEVNFLERGLKVQEGGKILDLACGTGAHAVEFSRRGYQVVGLDLSQQMLTHAGERAERSGLTLEFLQADMREMRFEAEFDGVYCWNTSFGYFEQETNRRVLDRIHCSLKKGGKFLLGVMNRDYVASHSPSSVHFERASYTCVDQMHMDWLTSRMHVKRTLMKLEADGKREIHYSIRLYSVHELIKLFQEHGFRMERVSGQIATPGAFLGNHSPHLLFEAEKY